MSSFKTFIPTKKYDIIHELGICGCGCPDETYKAVHDMLIAFKNHADAIGDNPYKYFMAYALDRLKFIEHGTSIIGSWLTDKGKELLEALTDFAEYDYDWNIAANTMPNEFYYEGE